MCLSPTLLRIERLPAHGRAARRTLPLLCETVEKGRRIVELFNSAARLKTAVFFLASLHLIVGQAPRNDVLKCSFAKERKKCVLIAHILVVQCHRGHLTGNLFLAIDLYLSLVPARRCLPKATCAGLQSRKAWPRSGCPTGMASAFKISSRPAIKCSQEVSGFATITGRYVGMYDVS